MKPSLCTVGLMAWASAASAADLPDPMRPPASVVRINASRPGMAPPAPAASEAAVSAVVREKPARSLRLSAVMLADAPGRDAALIDGRVLYVGDKLPQGVLMRIDATGVTLRDGAGKAARLPLFDRASPAEAASAAVAASASPPSGAVASGKEQP
ncbi:MAG: hypothetical protein RI907_3720 [Pseudomonadota bacterium]|jgi:hypothetical protein